MKKNVFFFDWCLRHQSNTHICLVKTSRTCVWDTLFSSVKSWNCTPLRGRRIEPGSKKACVTATAQLVPWAKMATVTFEISNRSSLRSCWPLTRAKNGFDHPDVFVQCKISFEWKINLFLLIGAFGINRNTHFCVVKTPPTSTWDTLFWMWAPRKEELTSKQTRHQISPRPNAMRKTAWVRIPQV